MFVYVISLRKLLENSCCMVFLEIVVVKLPLVIVESLRLFALFVDELWKM